MDLRRQVADSRTNVRLIRTHWAGGGTLLDLGANIGEVALGCADLFDQVVAVEAHPETFLVAQERTRHEPRVRLLLAAVAATGGLSYFVSSPSPCSLGATARPRPRLRRPDYYRVVQTVALRDLVTPDVTVVKMDIEGLEYECLDGFCMPAAVRLLVVECHSRGRPLPDFGMVRVGTSKVSEEWGLATHVYGVK